MSLEDNLPNSVFLKGKFTVHEKKLPVKGDRRIQGLNKEKVVSER